MFYIALALVPLFWIKPPVTTFGMVAWLAWAFICGMLWGVRSELGKLLLAEAKRAERDLNK